MFFPRMRDLFRAFGEEAKAGILSRLARGLGANGRPLKDKKRKDGDPLGGSSVAAQIAAAVLTTRANGFSLLVHGIEATVFNAGRKNGRTKQPARKVMGFTRAERQRWTQRAADELARQITKQIARGAA
jgi:hypothetical protein